VGPSLNLDVALRELSVALKPDRQPFPSGPYTSALTADATHSLTVEGTFRWTSGAIRTQPFLLVKTRIKVLGVAIISGAAENGPALESTTLELAGSSTISGPVRLFSSGRLANSGGLELQDGAQFLLGDGGNQALANIDTGHIQVNAGSITSEILFQNAGGILISGGTLTFAPGSGLTQSGGKLEVQSGILRGSILLSGGSAQINGGARIETAGASIGVSKAVLDGAGYVESGIVQQQGTLRGNLEFGTLRFVSTLTENNAAFESEIRSRVDFDKVTVGSANLRGGRLDIRIADNLNLDEIQFSDRFEILHATSPAGLLDGALQTYFRDVPPGQRIQTANGKGSFVVETTAQSVILRDYLKTQPQVEFAVEPPISYPLAKELSNGEYGIARVPLDPTASVPFPTTFNWQNASITAAISDNFDPEVDFIELKPAGELALAAFGLGHRVFYKQVEIAFAGVDFSNGADGFVVTFNSRAMTEGVQAVLQAMAYGNSAFGGFTFADPGVKVLDRTVTLTFKAGEEQTFEKKITFPTLVGLIPTGDFNTCADEPAVLIEMLGIFSDGTRASVPNLPVTFTQIGTPGTVDLQRVEYFFDSLLVLHQPSPSMVTVSPDYQFGFGQANPQPRDFVIYDRIRAVAGPFTNDFQVSPRDCSQHNDVEFAINALCWYLDTYQKISESAVAHSLAGPKQKVSLPLGYGIQSLMRQTPLGTALAAFYWRHTTEVTTLTRQHPDLAALAQRTLLDFQPALSALLAGKGTSFQITQAMIDNLRSAWTGLLELGSPELKEDLRIQRARFHNFQDFVGKNFADWAELLSIPAPTQPYIFTSAAALRNGQFSLEANYVSGLEFSLWRTPDLPVPVWKQVPNQAVSIGALNVILVDPTPPSTTTFYQVRAQ
jgi:hypothetical protein